MIVLLLALVNVIVLGLMIKYEGLWIMLIFLFSQKGLAHFLCENNTKAWLFPRATLCVHMYNILVLTM